MCEVRIIYVLFIYLSTDLTRTVLFYISVFGEPYFSPGAYLTHKPW